MDRRAMHLLWVVTVLWVVTSCFRPLQFPDLWWQLDEGLQIVTDLSLTPSVRTFGHPADPLCNEYLVYEVVMAALFKISGLWGVWLANSLIALSSSCLLFFYLLRSKGLHQLSLWFTFLIIFLLAYIRFQQRPEQLANLCYLALGIFFIYRPSGVFKLSQLAILGAIFAIWANVHGSFIIGFWMIGLFYLSLLISTPANYRQTLNSLAKISAAAALGTLFNPDGYRRFALPFHLQQNPWSKELIPEMAPPGAGFMALLFLSAIVAFFSIRSCKSNRSWLFCLFASAFALSLVSNRYINLVALALTLILLQRLRDPFLLLPSPVGIFRTAKICGAGLAIVLVLLLAILQTISFPKTSPYLDLRAIGEEPLAAISAESGAKKIAVLCDIWVGSLACSPVTPGLFPLVHSGMSRFTPDTLSYDFFLEKDPLAFREALETFHPDYIIVTDRNIQWALALSRDDSWLPCFAGDAYIVFTRSPRSTAVLNPANQLHQLAKLDQLPPSEQAAALIYLNQARDRVAGLDFLLNWLKGTDPSRIRKLILACAKPSFPPEILSILHAALGDHEGARELLSGSALRSEIQPWLEKQTKDPVQKNPEFSRFIYQTISDRNKKDKQFDRAWFHLTTIDLNRNIKALSP